MRPLLLAALLCLPWEALLARDAALAEESKALLYELVDRTKHVDMLLWIKFESKPVEQVTDRIDELGSELLKRLRREGVHRRPVPLPRAELMARDRRVKAERKRLMAASGTAFEQLLLASQRLAVTQGFHLAGIIADHTSGDERAYWRGVERRFGNLTEALDALARPPCPD